MYFSSLGVLELLARIHPYRFDPNSKYASLTVSLAGMFSVERSEGEPDERLARFVGRGDMEPLLNTPLLST